MTALPNRRPEVEGKSWEDIFTKWLRMSGYALTNHPKGANWVYGKGKRPTAFAVKTVCDFTVSKALPSLFVDGEEYPQAFLGMFDTKSTDGKTFTFSDIKEHQVIGLLEHEDQGICAGYIVYFRSLGHQVVFYGARQLFQVRRRESLRPEDGLSLGSAYDLKLDRLLSLRRRGEVKTYGLRSEETESEKENEES